MTVQGERTVELEEPPGTNGTGALVASTRKTTSRRAALWRDVPDSDWNDWRWQLRHRINTPEQLKNVIEMTPEEEAGVRTTCERLRMSITPYFAS